jgi:anaerobic glycerol-3-phosphate dehydrogenase
LRLGQLRARFPLHPWARVIQTAEQLASTCQRALELLSLPSSLCPPGSVGCSTAGILRPVDIATTGLWVDTVTPGAVTFVELEAWTLFDAAWTTEAWRASGRPALDPSPARLPGPRRDSLVAAAADLERVDPSSWVAAAAEALRDIEGDGPLALPPALGLSFDVASLRREALQQALRRPVFELASPFEPVWGVRLQRHLLARREQAGVTRLGRLLAPPHQGVGGWRLHSALGEAKAAAVVLASGSAALVPSADVVAAPWMTPEAAFPDGTAASTWLPQPFGARGVEVDERGGVVSAPGLFAAGAAVAGHDPAHDGTAFGFALVSALQAASGAIARVGAA